MKIAPESLAILICSFSDHRGDAIVISNAEYGRGIRANVLIWLREPSVRERIALLPCIIASKGTELQAYKS